MANEPGYLHGFSAAEQLRLLEQADFLAPWVYDQLPLPEAGVLLEIGAGVGAQTRQLLARTGVRVIALDREPRQLAAIRSHLAEALAAGRVHALAADGLRLPVRARAVEAVFLCWVLEHVSRPEALLAEACRVLRPGGRVLAAEVQNGSLTVLPHKASLLRFWSAMNEAQQAVGGDPFVGARLGELLDQAGFVDIALRFVPVLADGRNPALRTRILRYFRRLLRSALPTLQAVGLAWDGVEQELDQAFLDLEDEPRAVLCYTFVQAAARRPEQP